MKVATLRFDRTLHCHFRTLKISGGIAIFMGSLTLTWHDSRHPSRAAPRLMNPSSVGSNAPPPSLSPICLTVTLHVPQVPLPPQADGTKILCSPRAFRRVVPTPESTLFSGSSLMVMGTRPEATSFDFANMSTQTSPRITKENIIMPSIMVCILFASYN